jgi:alpha-tubulin suppressor-like RCC1 family protein
MWGSNNYGQLGVGDRRDRSSPVIVRGVPPVRALALGSLFAGAVTVRGDVFTWGLGTQPLCARLRMRVCRTLVCLHVLRVYECVREHAVRKHCAPSIPSPWCA